ncbi:hypothetical protein ACFCZY_33050 [Streptomyces sp. NPDC056237]|uniref:hypothetical protein n=1 Tax=Streptomyces sp. NPDC056237 TaxID=3345758 RepID=UPI0035DC0E1A
MEELRAEFERVQAALAEAKEVMNHRVIGLEQYLEALAGQDVPAVVGVPGTAVAEAPAEKMAPVKEPAPNTAGSTRGGSMWAGCVGRWAGRQAGRQANAT